MTTAKRPPMPPWMRDSRPFLWVPIAIAARIYFRKSVTQVKRRIKDGTLDNLGIPSYWDGGRWFIRLPNEINDSRQIARRSA
jgi:hypothetical protein